MLKKSAILCLLIVMLSAAAVWGASPNIQMTVINESGMDIFYIDTALLNDPDPDAAFRAVPQGRSASFDIERPNVESNNLGVLFFSFQNGDTQGHADFPLVRTSKEFQEFLGFAPEFIMMFYNDNQGRTLAAVTRGINKDAEIQYLYHPVLNTWGVVETQYGITVYQDDWADLDAWKAARDADKLDTWRVSWEHLYPGEMNDWLRSPLETRGWIMPLDKIYNVSSWTHEDLGSDRLERLTPDWREVTDEELVVLKAFGDFGWGLMAFQDAAGKWFFMEFGYDGWGAYGGMWYVITDAPRRAFTGKDEELPWAAAFPPKAE